MLIVSVISKWKNIQYGRFLATIFVIDTSGLKKTSGTMTSSIGLEVRAASKDLESFLAAFAPYSVKDDDGRRLRKIGFKVKPGALTRPKFPSVQSSRRRHPYTALPPHHAKFPSVQSSRRRHPYTALPPHHATQVRRPERERVVLARRNRELHNGYTDNCQPQGRRARTRQRHLHRFVR